MDTLPGPTPAAAPRTLRERYGSWALVTGASSGIGRSLARGLAARGLNVVLVSDQPAELEEVAVELRARHGVEARACCVDLARPDVQDVLREATRDLEISVLVNNASFGVIGPFLARPLADYDTLLAVNVRAYVALTHAFLPALVAAKRGALVFVTSLNALSPIGGSAVYTASKALEVSFAGGLWYELRGTGVDVLVVMPGPTRTGFQRKAGTRLAPWAMEPEEVAEGALEALGKELTFIPGEKNRAIARMAGELPFEQRIIAASQALHTALVDGLDPLR
jgi:short-subunit dehydrogenase